MGDTADLMLDGMICNICGVIVASESGIPTNCGCDPSQDNIEDDMSDESVEERLDKIGGIES